MEAVWGVSFVDPARETKTVGGNRSNMCMGVGTRRRFERPFRRFIELAEANMSEGPGAQHAEQ
jgi:hypothetical protein